MTLGGFMSGAGTPLGWFKSGAGTPLGWFKSGTGTPLGWFKFFSFCSYLLLIMPSQIGLYFVQLTRVLPSYHLTSP